MLPKKIGNYLCVNDQNDYSLRKLEPIGTQTGLFRVDLYLSDKINVLDGNQIMGNPTPRVEVTWKVFGLITRRMILTG